MRKPKQKSKIIRRPSLTYSSREERERKTEDRKFVIVVELDNIDASTEAHELEGEPGRAELPVPGDPCAFTAELPGDIRLNPLELPTSEDKSKEDRADIICGIAELPANVPVELPAGCTEKTLYSHTLPLTSDVKAPEKSGCAQRESPMDVDT